MARVTKAQLEARIAELEEQLDKSRDEATQLWDQLYAARAVRPVTAPARNGERVVHEYTKRDGSRWAKVEIGYNTYAHRQVH